MSTYDSRTQCEREDELLIELCREAGDVGTDEELIEGARANHDPEDIAEAARGDVAALIRLRIAFGLPIFS